ncbi:hypothetical protein RhiLY_02176 [Ceratobasidium sp. AG-Ba]|nr:hypothetical protein RhiLY_02176 [Ceratobasidium sp. AG-Ba]
MPASPSRTNASRQSSSAGNTGNKPKSKGKSNALTANGNGAFSDSAKFVDTLAPTPPVPRTPSPAITPPKVPSPAQQKKAKNKAAAKAKRKNKQTTTYFDQFVRLIAVVFILFTINKCHSDVELKSPVCQAVNQRILQPFVISPFNAFIHHPSVAPAIEAAQPVYSQAVELSQPLVRQAHKFYIINIAPHVAHLERRTRPYVRNFQLHYARYGAPYVRMAQVYYARLEHAIEPYVNQAISWLLHLWFEIQPKLLPLIEESKFIPDWVREHALIPLLQLREQYVDTHVYKMLQTVEEFGESREVKSLKSENHITHSATAVPSSTPATDAVHSLTSTAPEAIEVEPTAITITPEAITPDGPIIPTGPIIPDGPAIPDAPSVSATPTSVPSAAPEVEELEAWLAELRSAPSASGNPGSQAQPESEESEEQIAERERLKKEETARKRADIEQRHAKFEQDIHALGKNAVEDLDIFLNAVRGVASADLQRRARDHVNTLKTEAEKGLKGTQAYLNKLKGEAKGGAIKVALFDDVCDKVEKRFMETAKNVSDIVSSWLTEMRIEEEKEANTAAEAIKALAQDAQSNLGMDYAWLDDVTVGDWSRYHALLDSAESYGKELQALIDGTHALSEPNALEKGLTDLQNMLNGIVDDFQSKLKIQHDNGINSFGSINTPSEAENVESSFSFPPGAAAREHATILQRGKEEVEAAIKRAEAEFGTAAENVQAIFEDGVKQAGEAAHQATRTIIKAAGGTPTPESFQEKTEFVASKVSETASGASAAAQAQYEQVSARYEEAVSHASQAIHDATRSAVRAAGYTPEPETPQEHAESIVAQASSTLASVITAVSSAAEDTASSASSLYTNAASSAASAYSEAAEAAASVYSDAAASAHQATRSLSRAVGATPTPETPKEYAQSVAAAAAEAVHQATRSASRAAGYTPTPETPAETIEYVQAVVGEHVESVASAMASSAADASSVASSFYNEATRTVIKAVGGTPSPTNVRETAESLAAGAQAYYAEAAAKLPSYEELKKRAGSLTEQGKALLGAEPAPAGYEKLLNDAFALIDEYQRELGTRAHSATRAASRAVGATPTPETFEEHVESVVSGASSVLSSATEAVRSMVHEDL